MKSIKNKVHAGEKAVKLIFTSCGFLIIGFVILITVFLLINGIPAIREIGFQDFFFNSKWASTAADPSYGILPFIMSSVYGTLGAVIVGDGANLFSAILVLAVMILPSVISVSSTAISAVPKEYEEASLALGATKTETIFKVTVPAAKSGIVTAVVLGIGRAIGEAMAVMMVAGNVANMPGLFKSVRFLTTAVASEMSYSAGLQRQALFSIALVLFIFITAINFILNVTVKRNKE